MACAAGGARTSAEPRATFQVRHDSDTLVVIASSADAGHAFLAVFGQRLHDQLLLDSLALRSRVAAVVDGLQLVRQIRKQRADVAATFARQLLDQQRYADGLIQSRRAQDEQRRLAEAEELAELHLQLISALEGSPEWAALAEALAE